MPASSLGGAVSREADCKTFWNISPLVLHILLPPAVFFWDAVATCIHPRTEYFTAFRCCGIVWIMFNFFYVSAEFKLISLETNFCKNDGLEAYVELLNGPEFQKQLCRAVGESMWVPSFFLTYWFSLCLHFYQKMGWPHLMSRHTKKIIHTSKL